MTPKSLSASYRLITQAIFSRWLPAFDDPEYRRLWTGSLFNSTGQIMSRLAIGWLTLTLTNSPFWVGLAAGLEGLGQLAFGVFAGVLADHLDRRTALLCAQITSGSMALLLGLLALTHNIALWHILAVALLQGVIGSIQTPAASAIVYQIVGRQRLVNAAAAQMMSFNVARIFGSLIAGAIISAWGAGVCYVIAGALVCAGALPLLFIRGKYRSLTPPQAFWRAAGEGIKYAWRSGPVRRLLLLSPIVEMFGFSYYIMIPVMARDVLRVGAAGLGFLSAAGGVGAMISTLLVATLGDFKNKGGLLLFATASAGLSLIAFAFSPWYALSLMLAVFIGAMLVAYDVMMQTLFQLLTSDAVRGRVMGLYALTFGFNPLGGFLAGAVASVTGVPFAIGLGGGIIVAYAFGPLRSVRRIRPTAEDRLHQTVEQ